MKVRVLGALEIDDAEGQVSIGGPVPRRILTALVARASSAAPVDVLLDAAWGDDPPASAERTLQSHLARLRDALAPSATIERRSGGYALVMAADDIDAQRFERLVSEALDADARTAASRLRGALALWRSPVPYADLQDTAYPAAEATRLVELRGTAAEALASALLAGGDAAGAAAECEARLREDPYRERLWETLIVALYRQGRQGDALAAYQRARRELDDGLGVEPGPRLREIEAQVLAHDPALLNGHAPRTRQPCPYKGLTRYEEADADLYVGRERLVEELLARLVDSRFLVVVGPSGAGKSSLVRAGLVSALASGGLPGSATWSTRVIMPGTDPVATLADAVADHPDVLVVDQAEEALLAADGDHIAVFGDAVLGAVDAGVRVVLALRADFYGRLAEHPALARRVGPASVLVAPPDDDELRRIVTEPAARVGLRVEPALADLVVGDVRGRPGALPVLSTALVRTWEHREGEALTVASYRAGGGMEAALQRVGEEAWNALETDEQRAACRRMLLRLAVDENGQWVRRRARRAELTPSGDVAAGAALRVLADRRLVVASADDVEIAHEALLTGWPRLLGWLEDGRAHADIRERLTAAATSWHLGGRDASELYAGTRLQSALDTQSASPDDVSPLEAAFLAESSAHAERALIEERERADREARGRRRTRAVAVGLAGALVLAAAAGGFAAHQKQQAGAEASAAEAAALHADATRIGAQALAGNRYDLSLLLAAQAYTLEPSAQTEGDLLSTLEQGDAVRAVRQYEGLPMDLELSPDGRTIASVDYCGSIRSWPVASLESGEPGDVYDSDGYCGPRSVAFTPASQLVVGLYGTVGLMTRLGELHDWVDSLAVGAWALSPDGTRVAALRQENSPSYGNVLTLQNVSGTGQSIAIALGAEGVWAGRCGLYACVTTAAGRLKRFNFTDGSLVSDVAVQGSPVTSSHVDAEEVARFVADPTGRVIAIPTTDHVVRLVEIATGRITSTLAGTTNAGQALAFSPDGRSLAGRDGSTVLVWRPDRAVAYPERLTGHAGRVTAAVFTADGATLVTASEDHALIVWDLSGTARFGRVLTHGLGGSDGHVASTAWAAGSKVVVGRRDGSMLFIDPTTGTITHPVGGDPSPNGVAYPTIRSGYGSDHAIAATVDGVTTIWSLGTGRLVAAVSGLPELDDHHSSQTWVTHDGRWAATIRDDTGIRIIDMSDGHVVHALKPLPTTTQHVWDTTVMGWTADGRGVLVYRQLADTDELLEIDAQTGAVLARSTLDMHPEEVAADVHGRFVAVSGDTGVLEFLDPTTLRPSGPNQSADGLQMYNLGSSPDGQWLSISGGAPPWAGLWDAATHTAVGGHLPVDAGARDARARWTSDGHLVVVSGPTMRIYDVDPAHWLARACAEAGRTLTKDEWTRYLPGRPYAPACT